MSDDFRPRLSQVVLIVVAGFAIPALAQDVEVPDYFLSARSRVQAPSPSENTQQLTEEDAENVIAKADEALQRLAGGDNSAAYSFASVFGASVDYYDEGQKTPSQIAAEKLTIFRNYRSYSAQRIGDVVLTPGDSPGVEWASFSYRYEIVKKSGGVLRGAADANWAMEKVNGAIVVVATREATHRH